MSQYQYWNSSSCNQHITEFFFDSWNTSNYPTHAHLTPEICAIVAVTAEEEIMRRHKEYVEKRKKQGEVVIERWHGCAVGVCKGIERVTIGVENSQPCNSTCCVPCSISRKGLLISYANPYDKVIYLTRFTSVSHSHTGETSEGRHLRSIFLCDVVVPAAWAGGQTIRAEREEAVLPKWLVVYKV